MLRYSNSYSLLFILPPLITGVIAYLYLNEYRSFVNVFWLGFYAIFCIFRVNRKEKFALLLTLLFWVVFTSESLVLSMKHLEIKSYFIYHFLIPILSFLYMIIFSELLKTNRKFILSSGTLIICLCTLNSFLFHEVGKFPSNNIQLFSCFVIVLCLFKFKGMILIPINVPIGIQPHFLFILSTIMFYSLSFFSLSLFPFVKDIPNWIFDFVYFLNILLYATYFTVILLLDSKQKTQRLDPLG